MFRNNTFILFCLGLLLLVTNAKAQTGCGRLYVDSAVTTSGNGSSWATAFKTVTQALDSANSGSCSSREIWVAKGTYYPMASTNLIASSRDSSFRILRNGIKIYGGFAGGETTLSARNIGGNPTILSGDIGVAGDSTDNCYHVVTVVSNNTIDTATCLNGFTVVRGNATNGNLAALTIAGQTVYSNAGGGIIIYKSSPAVSHCIFSYNYAQSGGGMANTNGASPAITKCVFTYNRGGSSGGAVANSFFCCCYNDQLHFCIQPE